MIIVVQLPFELLMAQTAQPGAGAGYFSGLKLPATHGRFVIRDNVCYEATVSYLIKARKKQQPVSFELQYVNVSSSMYFRPYNTNDVINEGNITIHTILAGAGKQFGKGRIQPYGSALMGVSLFNPAMLYNIERFSFSFTGGVKITLTSLLGIYLQARALFPVMYNKVYVGWEPGAGLITAISPNGVVLSGYFSSGLYLHLFQKRMHSF